MKNKIIIILTILVVVMSLVIGIGIGLNLSDKKTELNNQNIIEQNKEEETQDEKENNTNINITQETVEEIVGKELNILLTKKSLNELTNQDKLQIALDMYRETYGYKETISKKEIETIFNNSSLKNMGIEHENIYYYYMLKPSKELFYEIKEKSYEKTENGHGAPSLDIIFKKLIDYKQESDKITISYKYAFYKVDEGPDPINLYYTYEDAISNKNKIATYYPNNYVTEEDFTGYQGAKMVASKHDFSKVLDKLNTYTYTFKIENNKLVLVDFDRK